MAAAMGNLKVPEVFSVLLAMLLAPERVFARGAFSILSASKDEDVIAPFLEVLGSGDESLDSMVLGRLRELAEADDAAVEVIRATLVDRLGRPGSVRARVCAARSSSASWRMPEGSTSSGKLWTTMTLRCARRQCGPSAA